MIKSPQISLTIYLREWWHHIWNSLELKVRQERCRLRSRQWEKCFRHFTVAQAICEGVFQQPRCPKGRERGQHSDTSQDTHASWAGRQRCSFFWWCVHQGGAFQVPVVFRLHGRIHTLPAHLMFSCLFLFAWAITLIGIFSKFDNLVLGKHWGLFSISDKLQLTVGCAGRGTSWPARRCGMASAHYITGAS